MTIKIEAVVTTIAEMEKDAIIEEAAFLDKIANLEIVEEAAFLVGFERENGWMLGIFDHLKGITTYREVFRHIEGAEREWAGEQGDPEKAFGDRQNPFRRWREKLQRKVTGNYCSLCWSRNWRAALYIRDCRRRPAGRRCQKCGCIR